VIDIVDDNNPYPATRNRLGHRYERSHQSEEVQNCFLEKSHYA